MLWHAAKCPCLISRSFGNSSLQSFPALGHLVQNGHPSGGFSGLGISPTSLIRFLEALTSGLAMGIADKSICVYG